MSDKALAISYAIKRKSKKKMADGGEVKKSYMDTLQDSVNEAFHNEPKQAPQESQDEKYAKIRQQNKANMGYAYGGSVQSPDNIVEQIRNAIHKRKKHMAEGGEVLQSDEDDHGSDSFLSADDLVSAIRRSKQSDEFLSDDSNQSEDQIEGYDEGGSVGDPDKLASAQDSMRKAFKFAEGGEVEEAPKKKRIKDIMMSMLRDKNY